MKKWIKYFNELQGSQCQCGKNKNPKKSFCRSCYFKLPYNMQSDLYKRIGDGYKAAFDQAVTFLNK